MPLKSIHWPLGGKTRLTTELKDATADFFAQTGQQEDDYLPRLILAGGDGLTYEKLLQTKRYLQLHMVRFQSFQLMESVLELWHTVTAVRALSTDPDLEETYSKLLKGSSAHEKAITRDLGR